MNVNVVEVRTTEIIQKNSWCSNIETMYRLIRTTASPLSDSERAGSYFA